MPPGKIAGRLRHHLPAGKKKVCSYITVSGIKINNGGGKPIFPFTNNRLFFIGVYSAPGLFYQALRFGIAGGKPVVPLCCFPAFFLLSVGCAAARVV